MEDLVKIIADNGISVVCVGFMIYFITNTLKENNKILNEINKSLVAVQTTLNGLITRVDDIENKVQGKKEIKK